MTNQEKRVDSGGRAGGRGQRPPGSIRAGAGAKPGSALGSCLGTLRALSGPGAGRWHEPPLPGAMRGIPAGASGTRLGRRLRHADQVGGDPAPGEAGAEAAPGSPWRDAGKNCARSAPSWGDPLNSTRRMPNSTSPACPPPVCRQCSTCRHWLRTAPSPGRWTWPPQARRRNRVSNP